MADIGGASRFENAPSGRPIQRSRFHRPQDVKLTCNVGQLIPFYCDEVLAHDTHEIKTSKVVRLTTPITPFMDNLFIDTAYFFVPNRLVWDDWKKFFGEKKTSMQEPKTNPRVPQLVFNMSQSGDKEFSPYLKSCADYLGIPPSKVTEPTPGVATLENRINAGCSVNALPFRAFALIWNEYFRDENLQEPLMIHTDSTDRLFAEKDKKFIESVELGGAVPPAGKFHDFFTSCLPSPQYGDAVQLVPSSPLRVETFPLTDFIGSFDSSNWLFFNNELTPNNNNLTLSGNALTLTDQTVGKNPTLPLNLGIDKLNISINDLRYSIALQQLFERDMRQGHRYNELLQSHFGTRPADATLQRPEFLGGNRVPITVSQVVSTNTGGSEPLGDTGAFSHTVDSHGDFIKSFSEPGFIIGVACVRYSHSYQQGVERFWQRKERFDYYWTEFANLGEQPVKSSEIYFDGTLVKAEGSDDLVSSNNKTFGYQEYAADYRYKPSRVSGDMRSISPQSLDVWHLADFYSSAPVLSPEWIAEDPANVDRVLAVSHDKADAVFMDILIDNDTTRPMPMYSIPGLDRV